MSCNTSFIVAVALMAETPYKKTIPRPSKCKRGTAVHPADVRKVMLEEQAETAEGPLDSFDPDRFHYEISSREIIAE
jgi:hypothetical protein